jgi:hypothetical protein
MEGNHIIFACLYAAGKGGKEADCRRKIWRQKEKGRRKENATMHDSRLGVE